MLFCDASGACAQLHPENAIPVVMHPPSLIAVLRSSHHLHGHFVPEWWHVCRRHCNVHLHLRIRVRRHFLPAWYACALRHCATKCVKRPVQSAAVAVGFAAGRYSLLRIVWPVFCRRRSSPSVAPFKRCSSILVGILCLCFAQAFSVTVAPYLRHSSEMSAVFDAGRSDARGTLL